MAETLPQAIGYIRVSTEEQATEGVSLEAQRAKVLAYCGLHGVELAQTYADEGLSGKRADNRPGLQGAITHTCECRGVLVVYSLSRLARSTRDAIDIAERLARSKADLVSITEKIDTTTSMGRFFFTTVAALAQLERDQISERTCMALAHKRSKGQRVSGLYHIVERYDDLADRTLFLQGHPWDHPLLPILRYSADGAPFTTVSTIENDLDWSPHWTKPGQTIDGAVIQAFLELIGCDSGIKTFRWTQGMQFAASREQIRLRPQDYYRCIFDLSQAESLSLAGRRFDNHHIISLFELFWRNVFSVVRV